MEDKMKINYKHTIISCLIIVGSVFSGCVEQETTPPEKNIEEIARDATIYLSNGNYTDVYNLFNSEMKNALSVKQLEEVWDGVIAQYGEFKGIVKTRIENDSNYNLVFVTCNFSKQGYFDIKFVFDSKKQIWGLWFVETDRSDEYQTPSYANTDLFDEEDVSIGQQPWQLPATLSVPKGQGPFPAIVLVHGSGPNDRDETIGPNKPFKDIAWGLASNGFAVLRYDKRTKHYQNEMAQLTNLTPKEEVIDDAIAAISYLENLDNIDSDKIFLLGHSLGAMMAPKIAEQQPQLEGIIFLAAPARSLEDLWLNQTIYLSSLDGVIDESESSILNATKKQVEKVKNLTIQEGELILGAYKAYWEYLSTYDQVATAKNLTLPMFFLQGERDYQVTMQDYNLWQTALAGKENVTMKSYPTLNHLFISGSGAPNPEEYLIFSNVDEEVIKDIVAWMSNYEIE
jgi:dienelactone hydrolase